MLLRFGAVGNEWCNVGSDLTREFGNMLEGETRDLRPRSRFDENARCVWRDDGAMAMASRGANDAGERTMASAALARASVDEVVKSEL